ncbi:hypothetical protein AVEN_235690-1 [Araneus ventricosus]|uniref:Uncharacterized protein n=1 Tax=Araneus ventricosus TaxID=182803 RepID=A0A4Y2RDZ9_ARAVE|nr:hypothetical protein AVEN_235690-1 [Araneus ventricosus]
MYATPDDDCKKASRLYMKSHDCTIVIDLTDDIYYRLDRRRRDYRFNDMPLFCQWCDEFYEYRAKKLILSCGHDVHEKCAKRRAA